MGLKCPKTFLKDMIESIAECGFWSAELKSEIRIPKSEIIITHRQFDESSQILCPRLAVCR
jgi:hypothetical protein